MCVREQRYLDTKRECKSAEQQVLMRLCRKWIRSHGMDERGVVKGLIRKVKCDNRHQHQKAADCGVDEKLDRRINPSFSAPDTNEEKHWDQRCFEEQIEQQQIE